MSAVKQKWKWKQNFGQQGDKMEVKKQEDLKKGKASSGKGKCFCCGKLGYYETMQN